MNDKEQLELRITAMLLGEASDFEKAQLEAEIAASPELAAFAREIELLSRALPEAVSPHPPSAGWQLAPARRKDLLHALGLPPEKPANLLPARREGLFSPPFWKIAIPVTAAAAAAVLILLALPATTGSLVRRSHLEAPHFEGASGGFVMEGNVVARDEKADLSFPMAAASQTLSVTAAPVPSGTPQSMVAAVLAPETKPILVTSGVVTQLQPPAALESSASMAKSRRAGDAEIPVPALGAAAAPAPLLAATMPVPSSALVPSAENETAISGQLVADLDDGAKGQIRSFTGGWAKGVGAGGGARGRAAATDELQSEDFRRSKELADAPATDAAKAPAKQAELALAKELAAQELAKSKDAAGKTRSDGSIHYGNPIPPTDGSESVGGQPLLVADSTKQEAASPGESSSLLAGNDAAYMFRGTEITVPESQTNERGQRESKRRAPLFENATATNAVSTFSLHVADVSFRLAEDALLKRGELPDPASVRPEEFAAAFDYADPAPGRDEAVAISVEQARHPTLPGTNLVRVSVRAGEEGRAGDQPLNLIVLIDKSGSMERPDRSGAARRAVEALASELRPNDRVTLATFDRTFRLAGDSIPGPQARQRLLAELSATGDSGTNVEEALEQLARVAPSRFAPDASNRVVLITDGIANLGKTLPASLAGRAVSLRKAGFSMDVVAAGACGAGDAVLEALARKADGRYFLVPDGRASAEEFARQLAGAFRPAASNVKVQVRFNPSRVSGWSLLGFDEYRLREQDFRNDKVDAAELAAAEQGTAVYLVKLDPEGSGEIGQVSVRFRQTSTGEMVERSRVIAFDPSAPALDVAPPAMRLAACATLFAEKLRRGAPAEGVTSSSLAKILRGLPPSWLKTQRAKTFERMLDSHARIAPE